MFNALARSLMSVVDALDVAVAAEKRDGCRKMSLGICKMPFGYALMLDSDEVYYFWLRYDGQTGPDHWNRWSVYRMAKANNDHSLAVLQPQPIFTLTSCQGKD